MFEGFTTARRATAGAKIHLRQGGKGPPLPVLQGYPETHVMWHKIATRLARRFTVVCPEKIVDVTGRALPYGHFLPEEAPEETLAALEAFLAG